MQLAVAVIMYFELNMWCIDDNGFIRAVHISFVTTLPFAQMAYSARGQYVNVTNIQARKNHMCK